MAIHNETGKKGEELAATYLKQKGFEILHANWRYSNYEIDIVASKGNMLHFIEVKTRTNQKFGHPEESVSYTKLNNLLKAGAEYQYKYPQWKYVQYNVLSITIRGNQPPEFFFIEDVYL